MNLLNVTDASHTRSNQTLTPLRRKPKPFKPCNWNRSNPTSSYKIHAISSVFPSRFTHIKDPNQSSKPAAKPEDSYSTDYAPYPKIDPTDVTPAPAAPAPAGENWTSVPVGSQPQAPPPRAVGQPMNTTAARSSDYPQQGSNAVPGGGATTMPSESNPYVSPGPVPASTTKKTMDSVKDVLGKWGKKAAEATKKGQDYAGDVWQHRVSNCYVFKSRLQEYAQKAGLTTPIYHTIKEGPSHQPLFRSSVVLNDETYHSLTGFLNRKAAEQSAAEIALIEIAKSGATDKSVSHPVHETGLCKNLLQEYAQKMNYAIPSYVCTKDEKKGRESPFSCTVDIGGIKYIGAVAKTKKEAELKAAKTALLAIKMSAPESNGLSDAVDTETVYTVVPTKRKEPEWVVGETEDKVKMKKRKKGKFLKQRRKKKVRTPGAVDGVTTTTTTDDASPDEVKDLKENGENGLVASEVKELKSNGEGVLEVKDLKSNGESILVQCGDAGVDECLFGF